MPGWIGWIESFDGDIHLTQHFLRRVFLKQREEDAIFLSDVFFQQSPERMQSVIESHPGRLAEAINLLYQSTVMQ